MHSTLTFPGVEEFNMEVKVFNVAFINVFRGTLVNNC